MSPGPRIAVVGAGTMGLPISRRLVGQSHDVIVYDRERERAEASGAAVAATLAEAVAAADVVLLSLPQSDVVREVVSGAGGLAESCQRGATVVDASTITPALARELAAALEPRGVAYLDAPVSGGPAAIPEGRLAMMIGGDAAALDRVRAVLDDLAGYVVHVGPSGMGQAVKLANNLMVGATVLGISEACALVESEGIDPSLAYEVFRHSSGGSRQLEARFPIPGVAEHHPASRGYEPGFATSLMKKDLALAIEVAAEKGLSLDFCAQALETYRLMEERGLGDRDFSAVFLEAGRATGRPGQSTTQGPGGTG